MASYGNTVLTSAGIDLVKRVIAKTATFEITRVATSSDSRLTNATISTIEALTTMSSVQQTGKVTAFDTSNSKQVGLKCEFTNQGLTNQYNICGVGIYAKEAGKSEILFAVAPAKEPETMPAKPNDQSALFAFSLNMYVVVGQASAMSITATTEGVVKSINGGDITPDVNGDVVIDDSSHAKFIEAELIHGHLLVPLVDGSGNPITDPAGNPLLADEYLPKSIKLGSNPAIYPGTDNTVRLPVYTQAEVDAMLSTKADTTNVTTKDDVDAQTGLIYGMLAQNRLVTPLAGDDGMTLLDESGNALMGETRAVTSVNGKTPGADGSITIDDFYPKQAIDNRLEVKADLLQMEDEHKALQGQITDNADHLDDVDSTLGQHAKQINQATGKASYAMDQINAGQVVTALSDGQSGYLTDERGNALLSTSGRVSAVKLGGQTYAPDSTGSVSIDTYSKKEINNLVDSLKLAIEQVKSLIK